MLLYPKKITLIHSITKKMKKKNIAKIIVKTQKFDTRCDLYMNFISLYAKVYTHTSKRPTLFVWFRKLIEKLKLMKYFIINILKASLKDIVS